MTLTPQDREMASNRMDPFGVKERLSDDLPNVLKNMLREFASRPTIPDGIKLSERKIRKVCDHKDIGSFSLNVDKRLTAELSDYPFEAHYSNDLEIDELKAIVKDKASSLPAVQMSKEYFKHCVGYRVQPDSNGRTRKPRLLVLEVNHDDVLVYDPTRFGAKSDSEGLEPTEISKNDFVSAWKGKFETTSTLWIEQSDQQRITQFNNE